jgi:hypothetical protein
MINETASNSFHDELIQANIPLRRERILDNKMGERKNKLVLTFETLEDPIPYSAPFEMEYEPKDSFLQDLEEPIEIVGLKLNIFHATEPPLSEKECFFLDLLKKFVEDSLFGILTKEYFALPFIDQPIGCKF